MLRKSFIPLIALTFLIGCTMFPGGPEEKEPERKKELSMGVRRKTVPEETPDKAKSLKELEDADEENTEVQHAAVHADITVSSTHTEHSGEQAASALVDGDLTTRWSSRYEAPQHIVIELDHAKNIQAINLHWETAAAKKYALLISDNGENWEQVTETTSDKLGPRVDRLSFNRLETRYLKFELEERLNADWGFSLYEIEVISDE